MKTHLARRIMLTIVAVAFLYGVLAYIILPAAWTHHEHQPGLAARPMVTQTKQGIPGDPLNAGLVGTREDVIRAMHAAGWFPADPITLKSSIAIIGSVLLDRPYRQAPVSPLYYEGRVQDLAFEKPDGVSADRRHHVRFWQVLDKGAEGRPVFLGAITYDRSVGLSRYTGQVTHHIAADIDAARDGLIADARKASVVDTIYQITGVGVTLNARNGGGDSYWTDGEMWILRLTPDARTTDVPPRVLDAPQAVQWKDAVMDRLRGVLGN